MQALYLNLGAQVHFRDGAGGTLHKLVVDPHNKQVTDLVILRGLLQKHDYVIPVSKVDYTTTDEIFVNLDLAQLADYPEYREIEFEDRVGGWDSELTSPSEHHLFWNPMVGVIEWESKTVPVIRRKVAEGIPNQEQVIGRASVVRNLDGVVGKVDHVWLDRESWKITHLVVHRGLTRRYVVIPFSWVKSITPEEIYVLGSNEQLREFSATQLRVRAALAAETGDRTLGDEHPIDERLVVAEELMTALTMDPRTAEAVIEVVFDNGVVTLSGEVENQTIRAAAEEIVHAHPGVVSVVNALEVRSRPWVDELGQSVGSILGQHML